MSDLELTIVGLAEARNIHAGHLNFDAVISIADDDTQRPAWLDPGRAVLRLTFCDVEMMSYRGSAPAPSLAHAEELVAFIRKQLDAGARRWLIHCAAGVSRSTAAGLVLLGMHYGYDNPSLGTRLLAVRRIATPNRLFVALCEDVLSHEHDERRAGDPEGYWHRRPLLAHAQSLFPDTFPPFFPDAPNPPRVGHARFTPEAAIEDALKMSAISARVEREGFESPPIADLESGAWYEQQYKTPGERYHEMYIKGLDGDDKPVQPEWAADADNYHVHFACAWLGLTPGRRFVRERQRILDCGSGVGQYALAWARAGFTVLGVEVSQTAVDAAQENIAAADVEQCGGRSPTVVQGSLAELHKVPEVDLWTAAPQADGSRQWRLPFDVAFSAAVMEHISPALTPAVLRNLAYYAKVQCHIIPMEKGADPSHIHIQSKGEWVVEILEALKGIPDVGEPYNDGTSRIAPPGSPLEWLVSVVPNHMDSTQPMFVVARRRDMPLLLLQRKFYALTLDPEDAATTPSTASADGGDL